MTFIPGVSRVCVGIAASAVSILAFAQTVEIPQPVERTAERHITQSVIAGPIRFLAADQLEGRGPATRGDELARLYLATELQSLGYEPAGPGGRWQQPFDIVGLNAKLPESWSFSAPKGTVQLKWSDEYIAASGVQQKKAAIENAELVFVGYGIQAPEYKWDDFKGASLKDKVLVMLNSDPDWDPKLFEGKTRLYYGRWTYKYESGARQGAAGVIIIHTTPSAGYPWQVVQTSWSGEQFELPAEDEPRLQLKGWVTEGAARKLVTAAGRDLDNLVKSAKSRDFKPVPLEIRTSISFDTEISRVQTANVAGILPGSDPKMKDEVVIYSAHHDHLGIGDPDKTGDRIYNGAQDNAAGCAQLLAIAQAMAALPQKPRRSIMMLFVAAEEQGLLGSLYYALHPTVPAGKIAANINYDGGNIWGPTKDVTLIGMGKSTLDAIAKGLAARQGRVLKPDQFADRGFYYRSDQFSFAKIGVPALYFDNGTEVIGKPEGWAKQQIEEWTEKQYHQPSDELEDTWNFEGMVEDAKLGYYSGWLIAQNEEMPRWNPGDEFEAARKKALAGVGSE